MKKIVILVLMVALAIGGYKILKFQSKTNLYINSKFATVDDMIEQLRSSTIKTFDYVKSNVKNRNLSLSDFSDLAKGGRAKERPAEGVKLYLKHGGVVVGKLLEKVGNEYTVEWKGEKYVFDEKQIDRAEYKTDRDVQWPYKNDVVVKKTSGIIVDGEISDVRDDGITVLFKEGGGDLEMGVAKQDIDYLIFAPAYNNKESQETEERLTKLFPKMKVYKEGNIVILTDSYDTWAKKYMKAIRSVYTEIYFKFFKLFKKRKAEDQTFIVIFDSPFEFGNSTGANYRLIAGFFDPIEGVLYLYNGFGEVIEKMVFEVIVGESGRSMDEIVSAVKKQVNERYHEFIEGQVKELTDKYWDVYSLYKTELTEETMFTLRHEFTHEVFHNWGLQNIIFSKPEIDKKKMDEKRKEFIETTDWKKKEELLMEMMKLRKPVEEESGWNVGQSWLAEGMATYCETEPIGSIDKRWLFTFQEAADKGEMDPLEFFTNFEKGSFRGITLKSVLRSYSQSWAFATFLMNRYPEQFIEFQDKMARKKDEKEAGKENLIILLECLNKDLPALEKEFRDYMATYAKVEDPLIERFMKYQKIKEEFYGVVRKYGGHVRD